MSSFSRFDRCSSGDRRFCAMPPSLRYGSRWMSQGPQNRDFDAGLGPLRQNVPIEGLPALLRCPSFVPKICLDIYGRQCAVNQLKSAPFCISVDSSRHTNCPSSAIFFIMLAFLRRGVFVRCQGEAAVGPGRRGDVPIRTRVANPFVWLRFQPDCGTGNLGRPS